MILGIDPGHHGSWVIIDREGAVVDMLIQPVKNNEIDTRVTYSWLNDRKDKLEHIFLEEVSAIFGSAAKNTFNFGKNYGKQIAILDILDLTYSLVRPKEWQKMVHLDNDKNKSAKQRSLEVAKSLYPNVDFKAPRAKSDHEGLIDAILIAEYGRRSLINKE